MCGRRWGGRDEYGKSLYFPLIFAVKQFKFQSSVSGTLGPGGGHKGFNSKGDPQGSDWIMAKMIEHLECLVLVDSAAKAQLDKAFTFVVWLPTGGRLGWSPLSQYSRTMCTLEVWQCGRRHWPEDLLQNSHWVLEEYFMCPPTPNISVPKLDEWQPLSHGWVAILGRSTLWKCEIIMIAFYYVPASFSHLKKSDGYNTF